MGALRCNATMRELHSVCKDGSQQALLAPGSLDGRHEAGLPGISLSCSPKAFPYRRLAGTTKTPVIIALYPL